MVKEKDYVRAAEQLLTGRTWEEIILTTVSGSRGLTSGMLTELFRKIAEEKHQKVKITGIENTEQAFAYALSCRKPGQKLFCAGSLYLIGELEELTGGMQSD